jgi:arylsulfatase A-like enzyme
VDAYDGAVAFVDEHVGAFLQELDRRGLAQNTIVVLTSDHGESFGEHKLFEHRNTLYREVIHVPLLMKWPQHVPRGLRVSRPVSNVSIAATLLDLIPGPGNHDFPGPVLSQLWRDANAGEHWPYPIAEIAQQPFKPYYRRPVYSGSLRAVIAPGWDFIEHTVHGWELFDSADDPTQQKNLAATAAGRPVATRLSRYLAQVVAYGHAEEPAIARTSFNRNTPAENADRQEVRR